MSKRPLSNRPHCEIVGCKQPAFFYPKLSFWAKGHARNTHQPITAEMTDLHLCSKHADEFKLEDIPGLDDLIIKLAQSAKRAKPDVKNVGIDMMPLIIV